MLSKAVWHEGDPKAASPTDVFLQIKHVFFPNFKQTVWPVPKIPSPGRQKSHLQATKNPISRPPEAGFPCAKVAVGLWGDFHQAGSTTPKKPHEK